MVQQAANRQDLGKNKGLGKGLLKNAVSISLATTTGYAIEKFKPCVRDAEVAGSNPVAPIT